MFKDRLAEVEERIHRACAKSGRRRSDITLIAVTKVFPAAAIVEAYDKAVSAGQGAATHDGRMIDAANVRMARTTLERQRLISTT